MRAIDARYSDVGAASSRDRCQPGSNAGNRGWKPLLRGCVGSVGAYGEVTIAAGSRSYGWRSGRGGLIAQRLSSNSLPLTARTC